MLEVGVQSILRFPDQGLDLEPQISSSLRVELTVPSRRDLLELLADLCFRTLDNYPVAFQNQYHARSSLLSILAIPLLEIAADLP